MSGIRLIDANALLREMRFGTRPAYMLVEEAPTINSEDLPPNWRKTAENPPKAEDADPCSGTVLTVQVGIGFVTAWEWHIVADFPEEFPIWMPMPKLPEASDDKSDL